MEAQCQWATFSFSFSFQCICFSSSVCRFQYYGLIFYTIYSLLFSLMLRMSDKRKLMKGSFLTHSLRVQFALTLEAGLCKHRIVQWNTSYQPLGCRDGCWYQVHFPHLCLFSPESLSLGFAAHMQNSGSPPPFSFKLLKTLSKDMDRCLSPKRF